jgi:hypothetical protein
MRMPQFTADASLYRGGSYREGPGWMSATGVNAHGVSPANGCPSGKWCCQTLFGKHCYDCSPKFFGHCVLPAVVECAKHFGIPAQC